MDHTELFTNKAEIYEMGRPSYPDALLDFMQHEFKLNEQTVAADIGAGTGKFTEKLLDLGCYVIAVEPNAEMARELRDGLMCDQLQVRERPAEATEIDDNTVDIVTVAQAFHWFDKEAFKKECERMLITGGPVCLIWNSRDEQAPVNERTAAVFTEYCPEFKGFTNGISMDNPEIDAFFHNGYELMTFDYPLEYDLKKFVGRCASGSYALNPSDDGYPAFEAALQQLFNDFAEEGKVIVPNTTYLFYGYL